MAVNKSKIRDFRFWDKWRWSGAVELMVKTRLPCLFCDNSEKRTVPESWASGCIICGDCNKWAGDCIVSSDGNKEVGL